MSAAQRRNEERKEIASHKARDARKEWLRRRAKKAWRVGTKPGYPSLAKRLASCEAAATELSALIAYPSDHNSKMCAALVDGFDTSAARERVLDWSMPGENQTMGKLGGRAKKSWKIKDDVAASELINEVERAIWRPVNKLRGQWFRQREIAEAWLRAVEAWHRHRDALLDWANARTLGRTGSPCLPAKLCVSPGPALRHRYRYRRPGQAERRTVVPPPSKTQRMVRENQPGATPALVGRRFDEIDAKRADWGLKQSKKRAKWKPPIRTEREQIVSDRPISSVFRY